MNDCGGVKDILTDVPKMPSTIIEHAGENLIIMEIMHEFLRNMRSHLCVVTTGVYEIVQLLKA
jgi:hypothetical protein